MVTRGGSLLGAGDNERGRIAASLQKTGITQFTEFCIKDGNGNKLDPISAVCNGSGTLYMFRKSSGRGRQLVLCDYQINEGTPVFLDICNECPVSLFGGYSHTAAISKKGEVIFINHLAVKNSPETPIIPASLPSGLKAASVACLDSSVVALSSNGKVFSSDVEDGSCALKFSATPELAGEEIVWLSGTYEHCLAVSKRGRVFARGSNNRGKFGLGEGIKEVSSFTEISSLSGYEIRAAYAGYGHSLFETQEGKILSCGNNGSGHLLISSCKPGWTDFCLPRETMITGGAGFCIAGLSLSAVFYGGSPPPNTPNRLVQYHE